MPMDKFTRQCQKSNMWARRRNNTASRSLESSLRHLEKGYNRNYRQYLRDKIRLQSDLRDLKHVPTEAEEQLSSNDGSQLIVVPGAHFPQNDSTEANGSYVIIPPRSQGLLNTNTARNTTNRKPDPRPQSKDRPASNLPPRSISALSLASTIPHGVRDLSSSLSDTHTKISSRGGIITSTPLAPVDSSFVTRSHTVADLSFPNRTWAETSGGSRVCKISRPLTSTHCCQYFPCTTPITYHTIGFRRDDLGPWVTDGRKFKAERPRESQNSESSPRYASDPRLTMASSRDSSRRKKTQKFEDQFYSINLSADSSGTCNTSSSTVSGTAESATENFRDRVSGARKTTGQFCPTIDGPLFGPKPSDPILEYVRQGSTKPMEIATRSCARVSIKDKLRGLRQLVGEMRARNENVRPRDWAVNYGERVPTRILLNPVIPL